MSVLTSEKKTGKWTEVIRSTLMFQRTLDTIIIFGLRTPEQKAPIKYL